MDNLKISVDEIHIDDGQYTCTVYMISRTRVRYELKMTNFASCQKPRPFLLDEACLNFISENTKSAEYKYNATSDTIEVHYRVTDKNSIDLVLSRFNETIDDKTLLRRVQQLEDQLYALDPYEVIETHTVPKWSSLDEFKALEFYKYVIEGSTFLSLPAPGDVIKKEIGKIGNTLYYAVINGAGMINSTMRKIKDNKPELVARFSQSSANYVPDGFPERIDGATWEYVLCYTVGWILINHPLLYKREVKIIVDITCTNCSISIMREKRRNYVESLNTLDFNPIKTYYINATKSIESSTDTNIGNTFVAII